MRRITNSSSKSSPIDRQTTRRQEEDDPPRDESPPPESSCKVTIFLLRWVTAVGDDLTTHFIYLQTSQRDLEIAHVVRVQGEPLRLWTLVSLLLSRSLLTVAP
ncbi:unnamed protein product [Spirodela intermedia]|uniref:Uncharacterized protein n=1 Tax=Spirodela intermedia TaxID=51605 RepID=A0ABN7ECW0_SPIIN|nr:unnamed protein product [Spirodela intermedia]